MSKAKIFLEIEIDINKDNPNDKALSLSEIAESACVGVYCRVKGELKKNNRNPKVTKAIFEYTLKKNCLI